MGLPMYVSIIRNPENGVEIQNAEYGRSGIMMRLGIVNNAKNESEKEENEDNLPHGTKVLK